MPTIEEKVELPEKAVNKRTKSNKKIIDPTVNAAEVANTEVANTETELILKIKKPRSKKVLPLDAEIGSNIDTGANAETKLEPTTLTSLKAQCKELGIKGYSKKNKTDLIQLITEMKLSITKSDS